MAELVALFNGSLDRFLDRVARVDEGQGGIHLRIETLGRSVRDRVR